jgi:hypothetical protein
MTVDEQQRAPPWSAWAFLIPTRRATWRPCKMPGGDWAATTSIAELVQARGRWLSLASRRGLTIN